MKTWIIVCFLSCVTSLSCVALEVQKDRPYVIENTHHVQLKSKQTGRNHELIIALPEGYAENVNKTYPVLYFTDAYWDMPLLSATYGNLRYDNLVPEFILVGLSYPQGADYGAERMLDFSPVKIKPGTGESRKFYRFVTESVVPFVEKGYRGDPQQRILGGVSMGGLFALTSMYQRPEFFKRYIAISPSILGYSDHLLSLDHGYAQKHKRLDARLFLSHGSDEFLPFKEPIVDFQKYLRKKNYPGFHLKNYVMDGLRHTSVKGEGYAKGLIWVSKEMAPKGPSGLEVEVRPYLSSP